MDIELVATRLRSLIAAAKAEIGSPLEVPGEPYQYIASSAALTEVVMQQAEVCCKLMLMDVRYYFAGASCARSAFEAAVAAAWICDPKDPLEKEGRWLGCQDQMSKFHRNMAAGLKDVDPSLDESAAPIRALHEIMKQRSIGGREIPVEPRPGFEEMLRAVGYHGLYPSYRDLCEIVHVGPEMVARFMAGVSDGGPPRYRIFHRPFGNEWEIPVLTVGWSIALASMATLHELGASNIRLRRIHDAQVALNAALSH